MDTVSRRAFLGAAGASLLSMSAGRADQPRRPRVAGIYTVFRHRSHAHVILEKFLRPYLFRGQVTDPGVDVVSLYADQRSADGDMTDDVSRQFKIPVFKTIGEALTLGGKELAVDAVLSIGEHGDYPVTKLGQVEYPRKRFFDEIVAVMRRSNRFVPIFNDKHLSYRWDWAKEMYDTSRKLGIPLMAGSSVPLAQRRPPLDIAPNSVIEEAIAIHGGPVEIYDFHGLEVLQSIVEARKGGEVGISNIEFVTGDALWRAAKAARWSPALAEAALKIEFGNKVPDLAKPFPTEKPEPAHAILVTYKDGFRGTVLKIGSKHTRWQFACKIAGEQQPRATTYYMGVWGNRNLFMALSHAIQEFFRTGREQYPVERTLLTTGALDASMQARSRGQAMATPHLEIAYAPKDFRNLRENGASWTILDKVQEPKGINPIGRD